MPQLKLTLAVAALLGASVIGVDTTWAQSRFEVGPRLGFDLSGDVEEFFIGADGRYALPAVPINLNATFDFYFPDDFDFFQLSFNALYEFGVDNQVFTPYAGAGIGISRISWDVDDPDNVPNDFGDSETDVGVNMIGGAVFGFGNIRPFGQAQLTFGDLDLVSIAGGLLFRIGE